MFWLDGGLPCAVVLTVRSFCITACDHRGSGEGSPVQNLPSSHEHGQATRPGNHAGPVADRSEGADGPARREGHVPAQLPPGLQCGPVGQVPVLVRPQPAGPGER